MSLVGPKRQMLCCGKMSALGAIAEVAGARSLRWRGPMDAVLMLREFCDAVERHDGKRFADLFCADGVYHDVFYGEFAGRAKIAEMIDDLFFKSATDMRLSLIHI